MEQSHELCGAYIVEELYDTVSNCLLFYLDLWNESQMSLKKNKRRSDPMNPDRRRKPVTVTDILLNKLILVQFLTTSAS